MIPVRLFQSYTPTKKYGIILYKSSRNVLAHGELAHQWARTLATTTGMSMERCEAARECSYLLAARKLRSSEVTRGLIQFVIQKALRKRRQAACREACVRDCMRFRRQQV